MMNLTSFWPTRPDRCVRLVLARCHRDQVCVLDDVVAAVAEDCWCCCCYYLSKKTTMRWLWSLLLRELMTKVSDREEQLQVVPFSDQVMASV